MPELQRRGNYAANCQRSTDALWAAIHGHRGMEDGLSGPYARRAAELDELRNRLAGGSFVRSVRGGSAVPREHIMRHGLHAAARAGAIAGWRAGTVASSATGASTPLLAQYVLIVPSGRTIVRSFLAGPGADVRKRCGLITTWSMRTPSWRVWIRSRCVPVVWNVTVPVCPVHHAAAIQPHPDTPHPEHASRLTSTADVVPIRFTAVPEPFTLPSYWTQTESLDLEFPAADRRSQVRYFTPFTAVNVTST